jgi:hypothetical protein
VQLVATTNASNVKGVVEAIPGWTDYSTALDAEKKKLDELCSAKNIGADDESNVFKPGQQYALVNLYLFVNVLLVLFADCASLFSYFHSFIVYILYSF